ncbi:hypothetical protein B566_EDAN019398, partial [Ephemera danica]
MGAVLLAGGAAGKRSSLPHARIMIHQPSGGAQGQSKTKEQIDTDSDRDYWMKAEEAKTYGLIDE